jgi:hypothetical protein
MTRDQIIAVNPIMDFIRSKDHELRQAGQHFVTCGCPVTQHKRGHRPVMIYPQTQSWSCHDCKRGGSVIDWVMIEKNVTAAEAMRLLTGGKNGSAEVVATYDYPDESGKLLFQCVRYQPKDFRQRQPDGKGGWIWNIEDVRRVLYRLPDLLSGLKRGLPVLLVEGEKDVDALVSTGFPAAVACNPMGAKKWREEYTETLRGATVFVLADKDDDGRAHAQQVATSLYGKVKRVAVVELPDRDGHSVKDISDWLALGGSVGELAELLDAAERWTPSAVRAPATERKRPPLTIRTIDEILAMQFDAADLILPNGYLVLGERTTICGMGGVGKSRLVMQLALCCRTGRDFLGWPTQGRELRWLFLQTENSCRRLQADLQRMLSAFTPAEREAINAGVFFHTLEADEDGFLTLDSENRERIAEAILRTDVNIIVFDPLRDFGIDDLNTDAHMTETLRGISRVTRRGNARRVPLVIHHALTGKVGIQRAVGFDRSSFGRNSKVLFMWTRAQINVAPVRPDDNSVLIIASGKCSNFSEFEPFAVRLDFDTMLYSRDDDFDVDEWRDSLDGAKSTTDKLTLNGILCQLPETGSIAKNVVIQHFRDEGVGEKKARAFLDQSTTPTGPIYEWRIKRSGKRDEIHLSLHPQPAQER